MSSLVITGFANGVAAPAIEFQKETGGIYSWMEKSIGPKYAFIGTLMWYASYIIWMVNVSSTLWIPLSNAIFGSDRTAELSFLGLSSTQCLGILGCLWILLVTLVASKGVEKITKVTSIGGTAVALMNIVLLLGGIIVLALNGFQFKQPILNIARDFTTSPNPAYQTPLSILSFLTLTSTLCAPALIFSFIKRANACAAPILSNFPFLLVCILQPFTPSNVKRK